MEKPENLKLEHIRFLDDMYIKEFDLSILVPYFKSKFKDLNYEKSKNIIKYWKENYYKNS